MSLRIACDLDGTVADMDRALRRIAVELFGVDRSLTPRETRRLWSHVRKTTDFWTTLEEIEEGAVKRFGDLATAHRWHVVFLTRRPQTRGESAQRQSQRWLQERGYVLPSVCIVGPSRGVLAGALEMNIVIDDRPETCLDVAADSKAEPILVWRAPMETIPDGVTGLGVTAVPSFQAALDRLEALATSARSPGFVERVRGALRSR